MKGVLCSAIVLAGVAICAAAISTAVGQSPKVEGGEKLESPVRPRQPGGILSDQLGVYLIIEGVPAEGGKVESGTLLVDTVDGKKLAKPINLVVRGAYIADHQIQPARLDIPAKQRCVLKGYEAGGMIGVAPAVDAAAKEQGWQEVPMSPVPWQWRPYFVALIVVEPKGLELRKP